MAKEVKSGVRQFAPLELPAYLVAFMLMVIPVMEVVATLASFKPEVLSWRVGAVGLLSSTLATPVVGLFLGVVAAYVSYHWWALRGLAALGMLVSVALLGIAAFFSLDVMQLRQELRPELVRSYYLASVKAVVNLLTASVVLGVIGFNGLRAARAGASSQEKKSHSTGDGSLLVAGAGMVGR